MNTDYAVIIAIVVLTVFCAGNPDLLDGLIHTLYIENADD